MGHAADGVAEHDGHDALFDKMQDAAEKIGVVEFVFVEAFDEFLPCVDDDFAGDGDGAEAVVGEGVEFE